MHLGLGEVIKSVRVYSIDYGAVGVEFRISVDGREEARLLGGSVMSNPEAAVAKLVPKPFTEEYESISGFTMAFNVWTSPFLPFSSLYILSVNSFK